MKDKVAALVSKLRNGQQEAFVELVDILQTPLYVYCFKYVRNQEEALDLVQEVLIRFYSNFHELESDNSALAWIYTIARHKSLDFLRQEKIKKKLLNLLSFTDVFISRPDFSESLRMKEILKAVQKLPAAARELIFLAMDDCLKQSDIASILGIPAGTVKSRLFHARRRLKEILKENYGNLP